jgi:hypothetical protein
MLNTIQYDKYFLDLIENDPKLKDFKNDLGLALISKSLDYKIKSTQQIISDEIKENYYPTQQITLLAYAMYRIGYFRFKKPIKLNLQCMSDDTVILPAGSRFSDGESLYLTENDYAFTADEEQTIVVTQAEKYTKQVTIDNGLIYFYVPLNTTYDKFTKVEVKKGDKILTYSQNFVKFESDYSYEIDIEGNFQLVFLLNNENGANLQKGDTLDITFYVSNNVSIVPNNMGLVENGYNLVVNNVSLNQAFEPFFNKEEMKQLIKYGRRNIGDIILNEDYRQFIYKNVAGLQLLKVWQENEENKQNGYELTNINKVFCCYITKDDKVNDFNINKNIINTVQKHIYGKEVVIRTTEIKDLYLNVLIKTNEKYATGLVEIIKNDITGYYDDIYKKINKDIVYTNTFEIVRNRIQTFSLSIDLTLKGDYKNEKVYRILLKNISVTITTMD